MEKEKTLTVNAKLPFRYAVGAVASRFFREMRDNKKIFGTECPLCGKVWVPARSYCSLCRKKTERWVELPGKASLVGWTGKQDEALITCTVRLEGADSSLVHRLSNFSGIELKEGLPVEIVWEKQRIGSILDIAYFQPLTS